MPARLLIVLALLVGPLAEVGSGQADQAGPNADGDKPSSQISPTQGESEDLTNKSVTHHEVAIDGRALRYTATAAFMPMRDESGELLARMFYMAYTKDGVEDVSQRPITFVFNGGPGSSSVWLHLGVAGPRRVLMGDAGEAPPPPGRLVDNQSTWLDATDLVFIDPVGTGYSRPAEGHEQAEFSGVRQDIESVGDFIRLYTTKNKRWSSPKFVAGESYGTTRAAGLSRYLLDRHGMYLNGLILVSSILDFQTARFDVGNDLPYALFLPTYTATAWKHGRLPRDLQSDLDAALQEAEDFALNEYLVALAKGDSLQGAERERIARKLARLTGLSKEYVESTNLRIKIFRFTKELLRDDRKTVGRLDSRFTGVDADAAGESPEFDPSLAAITGPYTAALNDYVRDELGFESDLPYEILTGRVRPWDWGEAGQGYVNVADDLRAAITRNLYLKVYIANGYYDLATPYFATEYTVSHLGLEPQHRDNISMSYYPAGHMVYIHKPSLRKLSENVTEFIDSASSPPPRSRFASDSGAPGTGRE